MKKSIAFVCSVLIIFSSSTSIAQIITTIAGTGTYGFSGDGGPATAALITPPWGIAVDATGNIYFADFANNRIRKIDPTGIISTFAGNGGGYGGDGGPATAAGISSPTWVAVSGSDVFISEVGTSRIRKVNAAGIITTYAGNGISGHTGDGGPATLASISNPNGVGVDNLGNVYIPDQSTNYLRKVSTSGIITTIAGNGVPGYSGDGGPATLASMNLPNMVTSDAAGNIYVAEFNNSVIRKINTSGIISTFAGLGSAGYSGDGGPATAAKINGPAGICFDAAGNCIVTDAHNNRLRKINTAGVISTIAGTGVPGFSGDGGLATLAELKYTEGAVADLAGNIYLTDNANTRIRKITPPVVANIPPAFAGGDTLSLHICENAAATPINSLLAVNDPDIGQTEIWSLLLAPVHGSAVVAYTAISTGSTLTPTGLTYTPVSGYSGTDVFKVRVTDGIAWDTITIIVTINPLPDAGIITGPSTVCIGATITLSDTSGGGTGIWSISNSHATISPAGIVTGVSAGTDTVYYTVTNSCGAASAEKVISVSNSLANAGIITGPTSLCAGSTITLTDSQPGGAWSSSNITIATIGSGTGIVTGIEAGSVIISYSVTNVCGTASATVSITVNPLPVVGVIAGLSNVCAGAIVTLSDNPAGGIWMSGNTAVATVGSSTGIVNTLTAGSTIITYTTAPNVFGCINKATFPLNISLSGSIVISGVIAPLKCNGDVNGGININVTGSAGPFQYLWSNSKTTADLVNLSPGNYTIQVKDINTDCEATKTFVLNNPPALLVTGSVNNDNCNASSGSINLVVSGGTGPIKFNWSNNESTADITKLLPGTYTVTVTDSFLCQKQLVEEVGEDSCFGIHIHDVITPNGDGINDVWVIEGIHKYPANTVQVFDKFGDIVFSEHNYSNDWGGSGKGGGLLPDGTYFYLIKLNSVVETGEKNIYEGSLLIKR